MSGLNNRADPVPSRARPQVERGGLLMTELSQVLCAVDFSEPAQAAFTRAVALCAEQGAHLTVVHAVPLDQRFRTGAHDRMNARSRLQRLAQRSRAPPLIS